MTCPKCSGQVRIIDDCFGVYASCWQCGATCELVQRDKSFGSDIIRTPPLGVKGMRRPTHQGV